jgi:hypothetical protein
VAARTEYLIDEGDWEPSQLVSVVALVLEQVAASVTSAESDIPWSQSSKWPAATKDAASVLVEAYVGPNNRDKAYMQTGVQVVDDRTRAAFVAFAPTPTTALCGQRTERLLHCQTKERRW